MRFLSLFHLDSPRLVWVIVSRMSSRWHRVPKLWVPGGTGNPNYYFCSRYHPEPTFCNPGHQVPTFSVPGGTGYRNSEYLVALETQIICTLWHREPVLPGTHSRDVIPDWPGTAQWWSRGGVKHSKLVDFGPEIWYLWSIIPVLQIGSVWTSFSELTYA